MTLVMPPQKLVAPREPALSLGRRNCRPCIAGYRRSKRRVIEVGRRADYAPSIPTNPELGLSGCSRVSHSGCASQTSANEQEHKGPELFFGLIRAVGTDLKNIQGVLSRQRQTVNFLACDIRLSVLLKERAKYKMLGGLDVGDGKGSEASTGNSRDAKSTHGASIQFLIRVNTRMKSARVVYSSAFFAISVCESGERRMASLCDKIARDQLLV
jgi:hypothetical protein